MSRDDRGSGQPDDEPRWRGGPTSSYGGLYGGYDDSPPGDPAYAEQPDWSSPYLSQPSNATRPLSPYWTQTAEQPSPPDEGYAPEQVGSPRWLWVAAGVAVVLVVGLAVALVIVTSNSRQQTVVAPALTPSPAEPTTTSRPTRSVVPPPTTATSPSSSSPPSVSTAPTTVAPAPAGGSQTVTYQVAGTGRAISITYVDTDSMLQTEFNVLLPWSREVNLRAPAANAASVTIFNVGNEVTCTVTIDGARIRFVTGIGLTSCNPLS